MRLLINGEPREFPRDELTVGTLLSLLGMGDKPVVVELNRRPVLPTEHQNTPLSEGFELEIVSIAAGG